MVSEVRAHYPTRFETNAEPMPNPTCGGPAPPPSSSDAPSPPPPGSGGRAAGGSPSSTPAPPQENPGCTPKYGHISLEQSALARSDLYHLPEGIVSFARSHLYHLPEGICITYPLEFNASHGILSNYRN